MYRVGDLSEAEDDRAAYDAIGRDVLARMYRTLPAGFSADRRRVLDFGCGAGRTLRHLLVDWPGAELSGCDVDGASIDWLSEHADGRLTAFQVTDQPGLDVPDGHFDVVLAFSVFTHLSLQWAGWMAELHRALAPDGLLYATFLPPSFAKHWGDVVLEEDDTGIVVLGEGTSWDEGGPCAFVSDWWLRAHWGRAFEILSLEPGTPTSQGGVMLRRRPVAVTAELLEHPEEGEPRELRAALAGAKAVMRADGPARHGLGSALAAATAQAAERQDEIDRLSARCFELDRELAIRSGQLETVYRSRSWRLTAPLRALISGRSR
jgi:SAM-dependent methyltransferase